MSSWTELSLWSQGCESPSPEEDLVCFFPKALEPQAGSGLPCSPAPHAAPHSPRTALAAGDTDVTSWLRSPAGEGKMPGWWLFGESDSP